MPTNKNTIFCTKCGSKNNINSTYCTECGTKLVKLEKDISKEDLEKKRLEDKKINEVTLKNMKSKISSATFIVAKVITKTSLVTFKPKQPTRYDSYSTKAFVILEGTLRHAYDITDEVKKKILDDLETDLDINQVEWGTTLSISLGLRNKGWNAVCCGATTWYIWPVNGSTVKSLISIDYTGKNPNKNIVKGQTYSQDDMDKDKSSETIGMVIGFIILILVIIFLVSR